MVRQILTKLFTSVYESILRTAGDSLRTLTTASTVGDFARVSTKADSNFTLCLKQFSVDVLSTRFRNVFRKAGLSACDCGLPGLELRQHASSGTSRLQVMSSVTTSRVWKKTLLPVVASGNCLPRCLGILGSSHSSPTVSLAVLMRSENAWSVRLPSRKCWLMSTDLCASSHVVGLQHHHTPGLGSFQVAKPPGEEYHSEWQKELCWLYCLSAESGPQVLRNLRSTP